MLFNFEGLDKNLKKYGGVPEALQTCGGVAQLGEHLPCKQGVSGSIPLTSTKTVFLLSGLANINQKQTIKYGNIAQLVRAHA